MKRKITGLVLLLNVVVVLLQAQTTRYVSSDADAGTGSLRNVISSAGVNDSIVIESTVTEIILTAQIKITSKGLKINGQGATVRVQDPSVSPYRIFQFESKDGSVHSYALYNLTLKGGNTQLATLDGNNGGAVSIPNDKTNFIMKNCVVSDCKGTTGGALHMANPSETGVLLENCTFRNNEAVVNAGGNYGNAGVGVFRGNNGITFKNCVFENNTAKYNAIATFSEPATFSGCYFKYNSVMDSPNTAQVAALVLSHTSGITIIENCTFEGNIQDNAISDSDGNAVLCTNNSATSALVTNCTFYNNTGKRAAVYGRDGFLTIVNSTFAGNIGTNTSNNKHGSALYIRNATVTLVNNIFAYNYDANDADIFVQNSNTTGSNNIIAKAQFSSGTINLNGLSSPVSFSYGSVIPDNDDDPLFATYTTINGKKTPELDADTKTIPLAAGSTAIGQGTTVFSPVTIPTTDQRGIARDASIDLGSYEYDGTLTGIHTTQKSSETIIYRFDNDALYIQAISDVIRQVAVYNLQGQLIRNEAVNAGTHMVTGLTKGIYVVKVITGNEIQNQKIIIK
ncbi:MAG: T9SS type A sorting domain-containing protein [Candidatus Azobacteroides sp.]|nr:T9SS type A sorting domain-containing protein [Candidatus Azobacteroides sp.]